MPTRPASATEPAGSALPDANRGNWVETRAPAVLRPYLKLARVDRPIGTWLLLFPCLWSQALAYVDAGRGFPDWKMALFFAIGAFVMRGAGCAYNDYVDRDIDAQVERTRGRPIPSGEVTPTSALFLTVLLSLIGLAVLVRFNGFTIALAIASLALVAIYPFMKRVTYWPQLILGLTFNWGALVGWAAVTGSLSLAPLLLYAGAVAWTIGYDTIYAHQDAEDDLMAGLKSTALRFGDNSMLWVAGFYGLAISAWAAAGLLAGAHWPFFTALTFVGAHFAWQVTSLDTKDPTNCLMLFKSNRYTGALLLAGLLADVALRV